MHVVALAFHAERRERDHLLLLCLDSIMLEFHVVLGNSPCRKVRVKHAVVKYSAICKVL